MRYKRIGFRWVVVIVAAAIVLALAAAQVVHIVAPPADVGHWRSDQARVRYVCAYEDVMATLPPADQIQDVPTSIGTVRVTMWRGMDPGSPVILLPGHSSGAPMWAENLPYWIGQRTIYALDPLGDAGYSAQHTPMTSMEDQATWIADTVCALDAAPVHVVGHSFGGANAAIFALEYPELVATLSLQEPVMVIAPLPASVYLWSAVVLLPGPQSWKDRALAEIGGTSVAEVQERTPMSEMIDAASTGYETALPTPRQLTDEEWQSLTMPLRVDIGGKSELAGGREAAERIRELVPAADVKVWDDATHSLPMQYAEELGAELATFWSQR